MTPPTKTRSQAPASRTIPLRHRARRCFDLAVADFLVNQGADNHSRLALAMLALQQAGGYAFCPRHAAFPLKSNKATWPAPEAP